MSLYGFYIMHKSINIRHKPRNLTDSADRHTDIGLCSVVSVATPQCFGPICLAALFDMFWYRPIKLFRPTSTG